MPDAFFAGLGVVGLYQMDHCLPGNHPLHLRDKLLPLGLPLGCAQVVI